MGGDEKGEVEGRIYREGRQLRLVSFFALLKEERSGGGAKREQESHKPVGP